MDESKIGSVLWPSLFVALLLHLVLWFWLPFPKLTEESKRADNAPIEVEKWVDSDKEVVQSSKAEAQKEAENEKPRYAGEFRNRVKKETQSPLKGRFQEGGGAPLPEPEAPFADQGETLDHPKLSDLMPFGSSPNQLSEDIAPGNETVLNTDPVLYASFINRIADVVYDPWVRLARQAAMEAGAGRGQLSSQTYITQLVVMLNREGEVAGIKLLKSCGVRELDEAPKKAFWESEKFPNPPEQMFQKDGLLRFTYTFQFELRTSSFNILPSAI